MSQDSVYPHAPAPNAWVPETRFGKWFLRTETWLKYVLQPAVTQLKEMAGTRGQNAECLLDAGCGEGRSFPLLAEAFAPRRIVGVEVDPAQVRQAQIAATRCACPVVVKHNAVTRLDLPDASVDLIFLHQLIHHLPDQRAGLRELHRVAKPGAVFLVGESCEDFIATWSVRWFFRHPDGVQHSAQGYIDLVREAGFEVAPTDVRTFTPWWSLPDLGIRRRLGWAPDPPQPTEILLVARKPG